MDMSENMFVQMYEENEFFWCITSGMVSLGDNLIKFLVAKISDIDLRALLTLTKASFQIPPTIVISVNIFAQVCVCDQIYYGYGYRYR